MLPYFDGLLWLLLMLGPLRLLQRALHKELQSIFLLLTRRLEIALVVFSILFLPGVLLHELSHYLMAIALRVRTGQFSLTPQTLSNGRLQLGYVETEKSDLVRDAFIGLAPLLTGGLFVAYAGHTRLGMTSLWNALVSANQDVILTTASIMLAQTDFWLWFYLTVVISSTMLPSSSDRRAWLPLVLAIGILLGVGVLAGIGPWMIENLGMPLNDVLRAMAIVFAISSGVHLVVLIPSWGIRKMLNRLMGLEITSS